MRLTRRRTMAVILAGILLLYGAVGNTKEVTENRPIAKKNDAAITTNANSPLTKGIYGIPFKVSLKDILKWCEENNVTINNFTEGAAKLMPDSSGYPAILESASFEYRGQTYLLAREFAAGEKNTIDDIKKRCTDKRITEQIYRLDVSPSENSENLLNDGLSNIKIYFQKDNNGKLLSYATIGKFQSTSSAYIKISEILYKKYGPRDYLSKGDGVGITAREKKNGTPEWRFYRLLNFDFRGLDADIWKEGVALVANTNSMLADYNEGLVVVNGQLSHIKHSNNNEFYVIYYESSIAQNILDSYDKAMEEYLATSRIEDVTKAKQMEKNF